MIILIVCFMFRYIFTLKFCNESYLLVKVSSLIIL